MLRAWIGSTGALLLLACGPKVEIDDAGGGDTDGGTDVDESSGGSVPGTTTSTPGTTSTSTTSPTTATTTTPGTFTTTSTSDPSASSDDFTGGNQPNGASCLEDFECLSGHCYVVGILGGICGDCSSDSDCPNGGCSLPNPLAQPPEGSYCNEGQLGEGCESDGVCDPALTCAVILDVPGVITAQTCSHCSTDADCGNGLLCSPEYEINSLGGVKLCVSPGSEPLGSGCDFEGSGDSACASGICAAADVMGLLQLGVCSECEADQDCPPDQNCNPAFVDLEAGLFAGECV